MTKMKKVGTTGRFGPRYGRRVKVAVKAIESQLRKRQTCPVCKRKSVKRIAAGIWSCKKCGAKFAGGAYATKSEVAEVV